MQILFNSSQVEAEDIPLFVPLGFASLEKNIYHSRDEVIVNLKTDQTLNIKFAILESVFYVNGSLTVS